MQWIALGAFYAAAAVAAGAFGAHGLENRLSDDALGQWETAARYLMYGGLALLIIGGLGERWKTSIAGPATSLAVGTAVFSSTVFSLALGGPRWLGAVTPLGGAAMIAGFLWLGITAARRR